VTAIPLLWGCHVVVEIVLDHHSRMMTAANVAAGSSKLLREAAPICRGDRIAYEHAGDHTAHGLRDKPVALTLRRPCKA